jgi:hypothetical protein
VPLLKNLSSTFNVEDIGFSVKKEPIITLTAGSGPKRILMWSQMHGNESTTTKSLFDVFNILKAENNFSEAILKHCTLKIIPILNPDGARLYTRLNANNIDLNRDAQDLSQPESKILLAVFEDFKPDFCFNLHGQRTIFSAGKHNRPATISFLAPAQDVETTLTNNRKQAMSIIVKMNDVLQQVIPNQVGIYDDSFNLNCVGDTFQSKNVPTILFEAGHFAKDFERETVREYICLALLTSLWHIAKAKDLGAGYKRYFEIPMNEKLFFDIIIRRAKLKPEGETLDIAIQFQEILAKGNIEFKPIIDSIANLKNHFGHFEIEANEGVVQGKNGTLLFEGYETDAVLLNNELFELNTTNT